MTSFMEKKIQLAGLSGSLRKDSYNTRLLTQIQRELLPKGVELEIVSIDLPLYNGDCDLPISESRPAEVEAFRAMLRKAQGILIVSPEYNWSIPGVLKNAIDWASRGEDSPIVGKPVSLIGVTPGNWGTARMQQAFLQIFHCMNMQLVLKPQVLINAAKTKFDAKGLTDETAIKLIKAQITSLVKLIANNNS